MMLDGNTVANHEGWKRVGRLVVAAGSAGITSGKGGLLVGGRLEPVRVELE